MNDNILLKREKASLANDIVQQIVPYIESSAKLSDQINALTGKLTPLMDSFIEVPDEKAVLFAGFVSAYKDFLEQNQANSQMLFDFQTALMAKATQLVKDYQQAVQAGF